MNVLDVLPNEMLVFKYPRQTSTVCYTWARETAEDLGIMNILAPGHRKGGTSNVVLGGCERVGGRGGGGIRFGKTRGAGWIFWSSFIIVAHVI